MDFRFYVFGKIVNILFFRALQQSKVKKMIFLLALFFAQVDGNPVPFCRPCGFHNHSN